MPGTVEVDLRFVADDRDPERFEEFLDLVMDEFDKLGVDTDYSAVASELTTTWSIDVADGTEEALINALISLRTALHAAGCSTPSWPATHEVVATRNLAHA